MKSIPKVLLGLLGLGLFALLNNTALAKDDTPHFQRTASNDDSRRDEIRQRRREASLREMAGLRQRRDAQQAQPAPSQPRRVEPRPASPRPPERANKPARGKRSSASN
ncbi:MAG: hypothetical protein WAO71_10395 [Gallionella sp.]